MTACRGLKLGAVVRSAESPYALGFRGEQGGGGGEGILKPCRTSTQMLAGKAYRRWPERPGRPCLGEERPPSLRQQGAILRRLRVGMAPGAEARLTCARPSSGASIFLVTPGTRAQDVLVSFLSRAISCISPN